MLKFYGSSGERIAGITFSAAIYVIFCLLSVYWIIVRGIMMADDWCFFIWEVQDGEIKISAWYLISKAALWIWCGFWYFAIFMGFSMLSIMAGTGVLLFDDCGERGDENIPWCIFLPIVPPILIPLYGFFITPLHLWKDLTDIDGTAIYLTSLATAGSSVFYGTCIFAICYTCFEAFKKG